jgi:hypothetical protein
MQHSLGEKKSPEKNGTGDLGDAQSPGRSHLGQWLVGETFELGHDSV